jgi:hypothetical protein
MLNALSEILQKRRLALFLKCPEMVKMKTLVLRHK